MSTRPRQVRAETIRQTSLKLHDQWQDLQGNISQVNVRDREGLSHTYEDIAPSVAKLQAFYTY